MITRGVKVAAGGLSLLLGVILSFFVTVREIGRASHAGQDWSFLAPGWKVLDPGAHDGPVMLLATLLDAGLYSIIIFAAFYGFIKLTDKVTQ